MGLVEPLERRQVDGQASLVRAGTDDLFFIIFAIGRLAQSVDGGENRVDVCEG